MERLRPCLVPRVISEIEASFQPIGMEMTGLSVINLTYVRTAIIDQRSFNPHPARLLGSSSTNLRESFP